MVKDWPTRNRCRIPVDTAPETQFGVADEQLALVARLVKYVGLAEGLARLVRVKRRRRALYTQRIRPRLQTATFGHIVERRRLFNSLSTKGEGRTSLAGGPFAIRAEATRARMRG